MRRNKDWSDVFVNIFGKRIDTSRSEKLLGVVVNQDLSWYNHLYGDEENKGLVQQLRVRIGMVKRVSRFMKKENLKQYLVFSVNLILNKT